eukprot:7031872-Heterocapsa_arctica.AAC.1
MRRPQRKERNVRTSCTAGPRKGPRRERWGRASMPRANLLLGEAGATCMPTPGPKRRSQCRKRMSGPVSSRVTPTVIHVLQALHHVLDAVPRETPPDARGCLAAVRVERKDALPKVDQGGGFRKRATHRPSLSPLEDKWAQKEQPILGGDLNTPPDLRKTADHVRFWAWLRAGAEAARGF